MISLERIATDIAAELQEIFSSVRICAVQNPEQFLTEIRAINPEKLPGVIIVFDDMLLDSSTGIQEQHFTLVAVAKFVAASSEKALAAFSCVDKLLELFPADGKKFDKMFVVPTDCVAASPAANYAAFALGITAKKGF